MDVAGHIFRIRNPENSEEWFDIPVLFQTMYQAYVAYCEENGIASHTILDERSYYTTLGTLKSIADTMSGYGGTIPLTSGGTGINAKDRSELLSYLGLSSKIDDTATNLTFPTTAAVKTVIDALRTQITKDFNTALESAKKYTDEKAAELDKGMPVITSGTAAPTASTAGDIYIKYSN